MNTRVILLLLLALLQCLVIAILYWSSAASVPQSSRLSLAPLDPDTIDEIRIGDAYDNEVVLVKQGNHWLLANTGDLPADQEKIDLLLGALTAQSHGWPVAQTSAARQRFQVANYYYQRQLVLLGQGAPLATLYLGTSPGFRKVHARNAGQDAIYSIQYNTFDAAAISGAWLAPDLLQIRGVLRIDSDSYSLHLNDGEWLTGRGNSPNRTELELLLNSLRTLQVSRVAAPDTQRELATAEAALEMAVHSLTGEVTLELFTLRDAHYIHSSVYPFFFELDSEDFNRLNGVDLNLILGADQP